MQIRMLEWLKIEEFDVVEPQAPIGPLESRLLVVSMNLGGGCAFAIARFLFATSPAA